MSGTEYTPVPRAKLVWSLPRFLLVCALLLRPRAIPHNRTKNYGR